MLYNRSVLRRTGLLAVALLVAGCSGETPESPVTDVPTPQFAKPTHAPPAPLVTVDWDTDALEFWPYTGAGFSSDTVDPVNLVFVGEVDPVQLRAALMSLDGDRTAFGFPDVPPFNSVWTDAMGAVQTTYADGSGWLGSVVQLQLGDYDPVRFHVRLFETRHPFGDGTWTIGAAHFELRIPGTTDHQVIAWELAEHIVVADLVRSGLLGANPGTTGPITMAPTYREIPMLIYNGIPDELKVAAGLPPGPADADVPIPNDGEATMLYVAGGTIPVADTWTRDFTVEFNQVIPRPLCSGGALDWLAVQGPVNFHHRITVSPDGQYDYEAEIRGKLTATPVDILQQPPAPTGDPFNALASDVQSGFIDDHGSFVMMNGKRITHDGRAEHQFIRLQVHERGAKQFRANVKCIE